MMYLTPPCKAPQFSNTLDALQGAQKYFDNLKLGLHCMESTNQKKTKTGKGLGKALGKARGNVPLAGFVPYNIATLLSSPKASPKSSNKCM